MNATSRPTSGTGESSSKIGNDWQLLQNIRCGRPLPGNLHEVHYRGVPGPRHGSPIILSMNSSLSWDPLCFQTPYSTTKSLAPARARDLNGFFLLLAPWQGGGLQKCWSQIRGNPNCSLHLIWRPWIPEFLINLPVNQTNSFQNSACVLTKACWNQDVFHITFKFWQISSWLALAKLPLEQWKANRYHTGQIRCEAMHCVIDVEWLSEVKELVQNEDMSTGTLCLYNSFKNR